MNKQELVRLALSLGAFKATVITANSIALSAEFRKICEGNGCGSFGRCYMCPPDVGEIEPLMKKAREYDDGLLYQTVGQLEDSFDIERMTEAARRHARISQALQQSMKELLPKGFLHLTCGGCRLCEECAKRTGEPCRHPDKALPSLESYGVDVYNTVKGTPLKYINGQNTVTFFGMILWKEG